MNGVHGAPYKLSSRPKGAIYRHPPLNPLPSREGKHKPESPLAVKQLGRRGMLPLPLRERVGVRGIKYKTTQHPD